MTSLNIWMEKTLGQVAEITMGQSPDSRFYSEEEIGMPFLQGCAEFTAKYPLVEQYCSQPKKVGRKGSILFSVRAPVGRTNIADTDYIIGRGLAAINGTEVVQGYLEHFLAYNENGFRNASQGSTFEAINSTELTNWRITFPTDRNEQTQIAAILSTIDKAIEQTEAIIVKQQRIKTGLMQDLLTRGIDEQGNIRSEATHAFKDSPLGRIPVEWEVRKLFDSITISAQQRDPKREPYRQWLLVAPDHIESKTGRLINSKSAWEQGAISGKYEFQPGDVIYSKIRPYLRKAILVDFHGLCSADMYPLKPSDQVDSEFLLATVLGETFSRYCESVSERSGFPKINRTELAEFQIALPPKLEQSRISEFTKKQSQSLISENARLNKLRLLKTGLMQDLLTGKVRVTDLLKSSPTPANEVAPS